MIVNEITIGGTRKIIIFLSFYHDGRVVRTKNLELDGSISITQSVAKTPIIHLSLKKPIDVKFKEV